MCAKEAICFMMLGSYLYLLLFSALQGDTIASCDSYGTVKLWDVRAGAPMVSFDCGPHPANRVAFDPTGNNILLL